MALEPDLNVSNQNTVIPDVERAVETLPSLFTRLTDQLTQLFDAKLALLRVELKEELGTFLRNTAMIAAGGVVALIGFALLNVAIAFLISLLFNGTSLSQPARYALGFLIAALLYLGAAAFVIIKAKNQMAKQSLVPPRTAAELERDKQFLKQQV